MAELTEQQESPVGDNKHPPRSRGGFWFGATILLLVIGLAGAGFFLFSQLRTKQEGLNGEVKNEMSKQLSGYQTQLGAIQSQLAALQNDITNKDAQINKKMADFSDSNDEKLKSTRDELNEAIIRLQRQLGKTRGDWLIADAEYLLSVANERLYLIGDVNTTRQALEAADQRLRESGDASAFKVRDQVIKDIASLTDVKPIDTVGLYSSIQALQERINKLVLLLPYAGKTPDVSEVPEAHTESSAQEGEGGLLDTAKNKLSEIVTIKHTGNLVKEILTPEQAQFIKEQLRTKLEVVKVALVQQNESLYQASLADTKKWLEQQFSQNNDTKYFVTELNRFEAVKIRSHFPDISISLKMLKDITKLRIETDKGLDSTEPANATNSDAIKSTEAVTPDDGHVAPVVGVTQAMPAPPSGAVSATPSEKVDQPKAESSESMPMASKPIVEPSAATTTDSVAHSAGKNADTLPRNDDHQSDVHNHSNAQPDESKHAPSPVNKFLEKIKQYVPGQH